MLSPKKQTGNGLATASYLYGGGLYGYGHTELELHSTGNLSTNHSHGLFMGCGRQGHFYFTPVGLYKRIHLRGLPPTATHRTVGSND